MITDGPLLPDTGEPGFGVYVHWPFCAAKCPYCDFNSHVRSHVDQDEWREALLADLAHEASLLPGRRLTSIFFGGGTPSLMPPTMVAALIEAAAGHWAVAPGLEITLEANPSSVEAARFGDLAAAGVNRVSLGLQALDDRTLGWLGRAHGVAESLKALSTAQSHFGRVSIDLIYARPEQSLDDWLTELERALAFGTKHVSLYQLTIEPGTQFATRFARGELVPLDPDSAALQFEATRARMAAAGLPAYETSNHAQPGAESRHNLTYWRYGDYAGVGPGAHGRRLGMATVRHKNWLRRVGEIGHGIEVEEALSGRERAQEALIMGLRLVEGVDLARIARLSGLSVEALVHERAVARLDRQGLVTLNDGQLRVTDAGALLIFDEVMTGFRVGPRGAAGLYRIQPDLVTLGKIIGAGLPVGAFGGRREVMQKLAPVGPVYQAGTLSGNPLAMAAGLALLRQLDDPDLYPRLEKSTATLLSGLQGAADDAGVPFTTVQVGSMFGLFFTKAHAVRSYAEVMACDVEAFKRFFHAMLSRGVYLAPSAYEAGFVSAAHGTAEIDATVAAARAAFAEVARA